MTWGYNGNRDSIELDKKIRYFTFQIVANHVNISKLIKINFHISLREKAFYLTCINGCLLMLT